MLALRAHAALIVVKNWSTCLRRPSASAFSADAADNTWVAISRVPPAASVTPSMFFETSCVLLEAS